MTVRQSAFVIISALLVIGCGEEEPGGPSKPIFEITQTPQNMGISLSPDKCIASILFDAAELRSSGETPVTLDIKIPLSATKGQTDMIISSSGVLSGPGTAKANATFNGQSVTVFEGTESTDPEWVYTGKITGIDGIDEVSLSAELAGEEETLFVVDDLDLVLEACQEDEK